MTRSTKLTEEQAREIADRLAEIKDEVKELMDEAGDLLRGTGMVQERARAYWLAHILTNLDHDHEWMSRETYTMQSAVEELEAIADGEDAEGDDAA